MKIYSAWPFPSIHPKAANFDGPYGSNLREMPDAPLFLYLNEIEYAKTWIEGGQIPLMRASFYRSAERNGTSTPDEVRQFRWDGASPETFEGIANIGQNVQNIQFINFRSNGIPIPDTRIDVYEEDAFLLCLSHTKSKALAERFENKKCCVEITDISLLISALGAFENVRYGRVKYTKFDDRSHFMKSIKDAWQDEYRFVIPANKGLREININLPPGVAGNLITYSW
ncbi:hypothetical protein [Sphingorhabdus sp. 109]|jgi:hypothetical protein|uniref:hypothetical protein n=1 Tax=Sphingorhabdus sp. 109 TaxID=2653173 RepID=UPI0012F40AD2|nr:hypothetical protein [Sphingorhabdus sp. 109]VWX58933.1 conserved hypothetical protein [Sphingorhabdus sp. 109]